MAKLKQSEIKKVREELLVKQGGVCAMCQMPLDTADAVLDHNHATGYVRGVCHRGCNGAEGRILNAIRRSGAVSTMSLLEGLVAYYKLHAEPKTDMIYPSFKTPEERKALAKKRRARRKSKSERH